MTLVYDGADGFKRQGPLPRNLKKDEVVHVVIVDEVKSVAPTEDDGWQAIREFTGLWKDGAQTDYSENHDEYIYSRR